jgi:predicted NAD/FAD-dependent oxidoreductase
MNFITLALLSLISAKDARVKPASNLGYADIASEALANGLEEAFNSQADAKSSIPVCIVGAGLSGLRLADNLKGKGYNVKLLEKTDRVGGKVNTFRKDGKVYNMGAAILSDFHVKTFEIIKKAGISWEGMEVQHNGGYDFNSGSIVGFPYLDKDPDTLAAFESYRKIRPRLNVDPGYLNASPELFVTTAEWLKSNDLLGLGKFATIFLTAEGYGSLKTTPALYFIQLMDIIYDITKPLYQIPSGIDAIPKYMANGKDITLNAQITEIDRYKNFSTIKYTENNAKNTQFCSSVVLAFPPHTKSVNKLVSNLSEYEKEVLDDVKTSKYGSIASSATDIPFTALSAALPPTNPPYLGDGIPMIFFNQTNGAFVSYHWIEGDYDTAPTQGDANIFESKLKSVFPKLKPGTGSQPALHTKSWEYFPHVTVDSLKGGFYKKFDSIQGEQNLYYATPLVSFELMENTLSSADYIADRFF